MTTATRDVETAVLDEAAARERLGRHGAAYLPVPPDARRHIVIAIVAAVGAFAAALGFTFGATVLGIVGLTVAVVCGVRGLAGWGWSGLITARNSGTRLDLYEQGLVLTYRGRVRVIRYDTTRVRRKILQLTKNPGPGQISYTYTVTDVTGVPVVLRHGFERPQQWGPAIERAVTEAQLPGMSAALDAGARLDFDRFWLTRDEIGAGRDAVSWSRVEELEVIGGWLSVQVVGRSQPLESLPVSLIPNYPIFRALVDRMRMSRQEIVNEA
ncbi:DUF6585 family protein [Nocardia sp. NPDC051570]|uniref:DUF6585 family protein n=1 Tax=Nocardia sp. NPDC051570 TaxID=3364324 RepID=UPI0037AE7425